MAVVGIFTLHLTSADCQQMLQGPKAVLDPVTPLPCPYESWPADGRVETHHVELLFPGFTDHDERYSPIRRTGGPQPRIAHPRHLLARPPGPIAVLLQVVALDLPPIGQVEGVGALPFHQEGALVGRRDMAHELRIAKPAIGHDHRRGQRDAAPAQSCQTPVEHALHPMELVTTRSARPLWIRATDGKIDGHYQFTLTNDDHQEDPINAREHPVLLPTPPGAHQAQLLAILFEHRVIAH